VTAMPHFWCRIKPWKNWVLNYYVQFCSNPTNPNKVISVEGSGLFLLFDLLYLYSLEPTKLKTTEKTVR
jgi:hypothetical protein